MKNQSTDIYQLKLNFNKADEVFWKIKNSITISIQITDSNLKHICNTIHITNVRF